MPYSFDQSEPTMVAASHHPFDNHPHLRNSPLLHNLAPARVKTPPVFSPSWTTTAQKSSQQQALVTKTSRKRSRDDAALNDEEVVVNEQHYSSSSSPLRAPELEEGWQYGEGMVLIKPNNSFIIDAGSQTGTWAEEKAAVAAAEISERQQQQNSNPILPRNNKSQRLDHSSTATSNIEETPYSSSAAAPNHHSPKSSSSSSSPSEPAIDDFTIHLGVGWSRISTQDLHIQAAARGWAKYIENNYPNTITSPIIRLESKGLNSYLVEAAEGFFLFGEDLKQGRLVSRDLSRAVQNLRVRPPLFDSDEVLTAAAAADSEHENVVTACERDECVVTNDTVPISVDIEMDLN